MYINRTFTITSLLALSPFLTNAAPPGEPAPATQDSSNVFVKPTPGEPGDGPTDQKYDQGSVLDVEFQTNFKDPHLSLFCSNINNAIENEPVKPPKYGLELDYAPQPNCYLQIQDGTDTNSTTSFRTKLFTIAASAEGSGNEDESGKCKIWDFECKDKCFKGCERSDVNCYLKCGGFDTGCINV